MENQQNLKQERSIKTLEQAAKVLSEHFDTVQIFVSKFDENGEGDTHNYNCGFGNHFARYGQIELWVAQQKEGFTSMSIEVNNDGEGEDD